MKVLHLVGAVEDNGGILSVIRSLHCANDGDEHSVWVNARYQELRRPALVYRRTRHLVGESHSHLRLLVSSLRSLPELRALIRAEPFDVLHGHTRGAFAVSAAVAVLWRRPVLFTNHTYGTRQNMYRWGSSLRHLYVSVLTPNMARHYGLTIDGKKVCMVSECCADRFFELPLVERQPPAVRPIRLVGLGNIVRWKNWHLILESLGALPPEVRSRFEFHHWGPLPQDSDCAQYHRELGAVIERCRLADICHFHGLSLNVETPLADADFFILPSTNEPCSVALIEALALGVPAIVSASGGNVDIVQPEHTGLLFRPDDVGSLTEALHRIARREIHPASPADIRNSVRHRTANRVAAEYRTHYLRVSSTRP
ncbi:MAG: glycosyltransferase family 4 protein [Limisphaerales bacterium]